MGERINHIATGRNLSPKEELLPHHHEEEATSMEVNPGALPRPGRVPEQELLVPRSLLAMVAEIGIAFEKRGSGFRVFTPGVKIRAKEGCQGWPKAPRRP